MSKALSCFVLSSVLLGSPALAQSSSVYNVRVVATSDNHTVFSDSAEVRRLRNGQYRITPGTSILLSGQSVADVPAITVNAYPRQGSSACLNIYYHELLVKHLNRFGESPSIPVCQ